MFTRFVECQIKPDKKDDFTNKLRNDVLPILQKQPRLCRLDQPGV
jgi:hypothetical protein